LRKSFTATLDADMNKIEEYKPKSEMLEGKWSELVWPNSESAKHEPDTGVERDTLIEVAKASVTLPEDFVSACINDMTNRVEHSLKAQTTCLC
jgi:probable 2-oxoglutarate dehydrogenase E1 component DHKTD1